jgi:cell division protein FtsB
VVNVPRAKSPSKKRSPQKDEHRTRDVRRSRIMLMAAAVVSAVILFAWFPASALYRQHASLVGASSQLHLLHQEDVALAHERKNLGDSSEISRIAREQYQLVSPGQQAYEVLPPSSSATPGAPYAGDPAQAAPVAPSAASELPPGAVSAAATPNAGTHSSATTHRTTSSQGAFERMWRALQFWR